MFQPNSMGKLARRTGADLHNRPTFDVDKDCPYAPLRLELMSRPTTVRADSSGSRGAAREETSPRAGILVPTYVSIAIGDRFTDETGSYLVMGKHPRKSVLGRFDHIEVTLEVLP